MSTTIEEVTSLRSRQKNVSGQRAELAHRRHELLEARNVGGQDVTKALEEIDREIRQVDADLEWLSDAIDRAEEEAQVAAQHRRASVKATLLEALGQAKAEFGQRLAAEGATLAVLDIAVRIAAFVSDLHAAFPDDRQLGIDHRASGKQLSNLRRTLHIPPTAAAPTIERPWRELLRMAVPTFGQPTPASFFQPRDEPPARPYSDD